MASCAMKQEGPRLVCRVSTPRTSYEGGGGKIERGRGRERILGCLDEACDTIRQLSVFMLTRRAAVFAAMKSSPA